VQGDLQDPIIEEGEAQRIRLDLRKEENWLRRREKSFD